MIWTTNNTGDGPTAGYATDRWQDMLRTLSTIDPTLYYVALNRLNEYAVSGTTSPVTVQSGEGFVNGRHVLDDASQTVAVPTPTVSTRIDRIILRSDGTAQTVRVTRLAGTEGSGVPPTLTQNSTTYEVSLARVSITTGGAITVTDERGWLGIRGLVDGTTIEWDTSGKKIRVKDAGITTAKIADANVTTAKIADANVTTAKIADANVTTAKIADANVTTAKIADSNVTTAKIANSAVTDAKLASGINGDKITSGTPSVAGLTNAGNETVGGNSTVTGQVISNKSGHGTAAGVWVSSSKPALGLYETDGGTDERNWDLVVDGKTIYLRSLNDTGSSGMNVFSAVRSSGVQVANITFPPDMVLEKTLTVTGATILNGALTVVGAVTLPSGAINTSEIADSNVTTAKIADANVTTAKIADANVTTAKIADANVTTAKIADANVTTAKVADDAIDDAKIGARVVALRRRQGGDSQNWTSQGTTTYTPGYPKIQVGTLRVNFSASFQASGSVSFPQAFATGSVPLVLVGNLSGAYMTGSTSISNSGCSIFAQTGNGGNITTATDLFWVAIGEE
jgi:uncharacterized protein YjbI with pentapeptide repeats